MKIFSKSNAISALKKTVFFTFVFAAIRLMWNYFDETEMDFTKFKFYLFYIILFILMFLIYFFTSNFYDKTWGDLYRNFKNKKIKP
ncbi:hypothetical protein [Halpernia sp.]|uniref:hypothetical protein n=1 Tax=Halpernia sp. TaxID=2782209 RepID=UPI003A912267